MRAKRASRTAFSSRKLGRTFCEGGDKNALWLASTASILADSVNFTGRIRRDVRLMTLCAMNYGDVLDEDITNVVLKGRIVERQLDRATKERKYVVTGIDVGGEPVGVVLKMVSGGKAAVITVYREKGEES